MIELLLLSSFHHSPNMSCKQIRDVAETVIESPVMTREEKRQVVSKLFGNHMSLKCIKKS